MAVVNVGDYLYSLGGNVLYVYEVTEDTELRCMTPYNETVLISDIREAVLFNAQLRQVTDTSGLAVSACRRPARLGRFTASVAAILNEAHANGWHSQIEQVTGVRLANDVPAWFARAARQRMADHENEMLNYMRSSGKRGLLGTSTAPNENNEELVKLLEEIQEIIEAAHPSESELIAKVAEAHDLAACCE